MLGGIGMLNVDLMGMQFKGLGGGGRALWPREGRGHAG